MKESIQRSMYYMRLNWRCLDEIMINMSKNEIMQYSKLFALETKRLHEMMGKVYFSYLLL